MFMSILLIYYHCCLLLLCLFIIIIIIHPPHQLSCMLCVISNGPWRVLTKSTDWGREKINPLPDRSKQGNRGACWPKLFSTGIYVSPCKCASYYIDGNRRDFVGVGMDKGSTSCKLLPRSYCGSADYIFAHCVLAERTVSMVNTYRTPHFCIFWWCLYRTRGCICPVHTVVRVAKSLRQLRRVLGLRRGHTVNYRVAYFTIIIFVLCGCCFLRGDING